MAADQTLWEAIQDPGVNPRLDRIIALLDRIAGNAALATLHGGLTGAASGTGSSAGRRALANLLPPGTTFNIPTLETFNELVGAIALSGAQPLDIIQTALLLPGQANQIIAYQVPANSVAIAMSGYLGHFTVHTAYLTVSGFLNYGLPEVIPITQPNLPITNDVHINRYVTGSHELTSNVTLVFNNASPWAIQATFSVTMLIVDLDLWKTVYLPIYRKALKTWITALAQDAAALI